MRRRLVALAALVTVTMPAPIAHSATSHRFTATYRGHGSGAASGNSASGSASGTGRGRLIGRSTFSGSASGVLTSSTCVVFSGRAVLRGKAGTIRLSVRRAQACGGSASNVGFSGRAKVTGGTRTFARATGTLSFSGTYVQQSGAVTISFSGRLVY
jgi:hypothetical protein